MSSNAYNTQPVKDIITKSNNVFVLFRDVNPETLACALGLYAALSQTGKNIWVASPDKISSNWELPHLDQITDTIGNRNLVISLKVASRESIDKVSYNLDESGQVFNLIIQPKPDQPPLSKDEVSYSYSGAQADLVIMLGINRLEELGHFYQDEPKLFTQAETVAISHRDIGKFANYHLSDPQASSLAEVVGHIIKDLGFLYDKQTATNILFALDFATDKLQHPAVSADTFELVSELMRSGALRHQAHTAAPVLTPTAPNVPATTNKVPKEWLTPKIYKSQPPSSK